MSDASACAVALLCTVVERGGAPAQPPDIAAELVADGYALDTGGTLRPTRAGLRAYSRYWRNQYALMGFGE